MNGRVGMKQDSTKKVTVVCSEAKNERDWFFLKKISAYRIVYFEYMVKPKGMHTFICMAKE